MKHISLLLVSVALASQAAAQNATNYWDFSSTVDLAGGVTTTAVGTPDLSVHPTYGEAYPGAGSSLNTVFNVQSYLIGDVWNGASATAMDFGTSNFSFSYWSYNDTSDGNTKGARIFDFLDGTDVGVQLGTNATNKFNLRLDTSDGGATISNNFLTTLEQPADQWVHVVVNVDRGLDQLEIFFNGISQGVVALVAPSAGAIRATRDMDIGVINSDGTQNQVESAGLDDLAFYDDLLSSSDIAGLAAGTLTPFSVGSPGASFCWGDGSATACPCGNGGGAGEGCANSTGSGAVLAAAGSASVAADDLTFAASSLPAGQPVLLFSGLNAVNGGAGTVFGDGLRCAGGSVVRLGVQSATGGAAAWGPGLSVVGGWTSGDTRRFQAWYRDPSGSPCGSNFNLSNGLEVVFQ
jgi:hypothetical protein